VRGDYDVPVAIRSLKRFILDEEAKGGPPAVPERPRREARVAVVGGGPAGLAAAYDLARWGYGVTVFDKNAEPGGMLLTAIPRYRLPRAALAQDVAAVQALGVEFRLGVRIGQDLTLAQLKAQGYNAVLLALGLAQSRSLPLPGIKQEGVLLALPFLEAVNAGQTPDVGRQVIVIGGGNVACDVARCARRLGAQVDMVCLERRDEMPAYAWDIAEAEEEGTRIHNSWGPVRIAGEGGQVTGVEFRRCTAVFDEQGRFSPSYDESVTTTLGGDSAILAIGQAADLGLLAGSAVAHERGRLSVQPATLATSDPDVFACGDLVTGPGSAVQAMASGHAAARSIHAYLSAEELPAFVALHPERKGEISAVGQARLKAGQPRAVQPVLAPEARLTGFAEVEAGLDEEAARAEALRCLACGGCSECYQCVAVCGANAIRHEMRAKTHQRDVGAIIVATGWDSFDPSVCAEYGFGRYPDVVTNMQFERLTNSSGPTGGRVLRPSDGQVPKRVVFIQCVGSRDESLGRPYCSQVCCMASVKHATLFKHQVHDGQAYMFYIDVRAVGKGYEEFVRRAVEHEGHQFIRGRVSKVYDRGGQLIVRGEDTLLGAPIEVEADLVVLAAGVSARQDHAVLARTLGLTPDANGFFLEAHPKLKPVESNVGGIFLAGMCQGPKDIAASIAQAGSAAAEALVMLVNGQVTVEPTVAQVDERLCTGCKTCAAVCPYTAITFDETCKLAAVNSALCQGCGSCAAACPTNAITVQHFTPVQIEAQIEGLLASLVPA
jgi:heterodisulfide reductase subunit A